MPYEHKNNIIGSTNALFFIFGATGDLARRKLFPAIYSLYCEGKLAQHFAVIGIARRLRTKEQFRQDIYDCIFEFCRYKPNYNENWNKFIQHFEYESLDIMHPESFDALRVKTEQVESKFRIILNRIFYLALAPHLFGDVSYRLRESGLLKGTGWKRLLIEKPFGYDLSSAQELNKQIREVFGEDEIYRIDHYLGKQMVQNMEVIRFGNSVFEPLWNYNYIDNVQITLSETIGVEERGEYYDCSGALRDMGQNHMLQMLTMIAMDSPSTTHPEHIRDEKVKVLRALRPFITNEDVARNVVRGQYRGGQVDSTNTRVRGYLEEDNIKPRSTTETYFAARVFVDNARWAGVPFYIRTGKRLPTKTTEVVIQFKSLSPTVYLEQKYVLEPNLLVIRIHPTEGIYLKINGKKVDSNSTVVPIAMNVCQSGVAEMNSPEAYERLLDDAVQGNSTYFTRWDEVETAWSFVDRIALAWTEEQRDHPLYPYMAGTWGPEAAAALPQRDGFHWWPVYDQQDSRAISSKKTETEKNTHR